MKRVGWTLIALIASFAAGMYFKPVPAHEELTQKLDALTKKNKDLERTIELQKSVDLTRSTTITESPDGHKVTRIEEKSLKNVSTSKSIKSSSNETSALKSEETHITENPRGPLVSLLAAVPLTSLTSGLVYGAAVTFPMPDLPIIRNVELGIWTVPQSDFLMGLSFGWRFH